MLNSVLDFLSQLRQHNDRTWFEAHRADYDRAREDFEAFFFGLFPALGLDRGSHKASLWLHRIHRDVRFSREKTPYKTHFSGVLQAGGKKAPGLGVYVHVEPGHESIVAGGLWAPEPAQLKRFRLDMEDGPRAFLQIIQSPQFLAHVNLMDGERLKKVPKGFPEDHPASELFRWKQVVAWKRYQDDEVLAPDFARRVTEAAKALDPFLRYLEVSSGMVAETD